MKIFEYSVLRYRHSLVIGEIVNLGILIFFPEEKRLVFRSPPSLKRLESLYPPDDLNIEFLNKYLVGFNKQANKLTEIWSHQDEINIPFLSEIIPQYFLVEDASSLQFSEPQKALYKDADLIAKQYYDLFLQHYGSGEQV